MRPGQTAAPVPAPPAAPELAFVLQHRADLALSPEQVRMLTAANEQYQKATATVRQALENAANGSRQEMAGRGARGETEQELQARFAAVSDYSRQLALARRTAWEAIAPRLAAPQRQRAEVLWDRHLKGAGG